MNDLYAEYRRKFQLYRTALELGKQLVVIWDFLLQGEKIKLEESFRSMSSDDAVERAKAKAYIQSFLRSKRK